MAAGTHRDPSEVPTQPKQGIKEPPNTCFGNTIGCCICLCCIIVLIPAIVLLVIYLCFRSTWDKVTTAAGGIIPHSHAALLDLHAETFSEAQQDLLDNDNIKLGELSWWTDSFNQGARDASCSYAQTARIMQNEIDHPGASFLDDYIQKGMYCAVSDDLYQDGANCGKCFAIQVGAHASVTVQVINDGASGTNHFDCYETAFNEMTEPDGTGNVDMTYQEVPCESKHLYAVIISTNSHLNVVFAGGKTNIASADMIVDNQVHRMIRKEGSATWMAPRIHSHNSNLRSQHNPDASHHQTQQPPPSGAVVSFEVVYSDSTTTILDDNCFESTGIVEGSVCIGGGESLPAISDVEDEEESSDETTTTIKINSSEASDAEDTSDAVEETVVETNTDTEEEVEGGDVSDGDDEPYDPALDESKDPAPSDGEEKAANTKEVSCCVWGHRTNCPFWTSLTTGNASYCQKEENCSKSCQGTWLTVELEDEYA